MKNILWCATLFTLWICNVSASDTPDNPALVKSIKVQPDKAPDCTSLKTMAESVTRDCKNNDAKAIAIYNFMQLTHYHRNYPSEDGGLSSLKEITNYGWSLCGGLHSEQSSLWRQLGWKWRFVGWDGHTTVEAFYDDRWHYLDIFLKFYAWMPDGKGGRTIAGEDDLTKNPQELITDAFVMDKDRNVVYMKNNQFQMNGEKSNWRAPSFLCCGDSLAGTIEGLKTHHQAGSPEGWMGIEHSDKGYSTDVNLAPGYALTNMWDAVPDAWYWKGEKIAPGHTCSGHKDTRNDPGIGLVLEPYYNSKPVRSYANGVLSFTPSFSTEEVLKSFVSVQNAKYSDKTLVPAEAGKPGEVVFRMAAPYLMTRASGEATGAEKIEVSVNEGKTFVPADLRDFSTVVKGKMSALVKITFKEPLKALKFETVLQNNPGALPYLSPGKNTVSISAADAQALGNNKLVVTYAYRLGSRAKSFEQLCESGKEIAKQHNAKWSDAVTYVQKTFTAKDLPATFDIDCPTPKGQFPVYPRMMFIRREVLAMDATPQPLPEGAVEAKLDPNDELMTLPNPFLVGSEEPPVIKPRPTRTVEIPLNYVQFVDKTGAIADKGTLRWPKAPAEEEKVLACVVHIDGELKDLPIKNLASAKILVPIVRGHGSTAAQLGLSFLKAPVAKGAALDFKTLPGPDCTIIVPKQPGDTPYAPAKVFPMDVTKAFRAITAGEAKFNGVALRMVPNRSVDDGYTVRCDVSSTEKITLQIEVYTDKD